MKPKRTNKKEPIGIVGGGIIGLALGWQLARRGAAVTLFERDDAGRGASWVAAGMLAPQSEVGFEDEDFLRLGQLSLKLYPKFLGELEEDSGVHVPLDEHGTLIVGIDRDDTEYLHRLFKFREGLKLPVRWLTGSEAREIEPLLSPKSSSGIWIPDDCQVNNRLLLDALKTAFTRSGGELRERSPVQSVFIEGGEIRGIRTEYGRIDVSTAVIAAGCWSGRVDGIPDRLRPPVRPVKGQIVSLLLNASYDFTRVVRTPDIYMLPKGDGRLLIGASQEEMGFDTSVTAGPVMRLLEQGWETMPFIYDLELERIDVGLRPGSRDHRPIVGGTEVEGLYYSTGHFRDGILLAPVTAYALSEQILDGAAWSIFESYDPSRYYRSR